MDNNQQKDNRPGGGRMPNGNKVPFMAILAIALVVILGITMFSGMFRSSSSTEISYDKFLDWLDAGYIKSVTIGSSKIDIELKGDELLTLTGQGSVTYYTGNPGDLFLVERLNKKDGVAIVMVTHDLKNVLPYASKILHLKQRTVFYGAPAEYEESPEGREFLGGGRT